MADIYWAGDFNMLGSYPGTYPGGMTWDQTMSEDPGHDWGSAADQDYSFTLLGDNYTPASYTEGITNQSRVIGAPCVRGAQTVTPSAGGSAASVTLLLARVGLPGTFTVELRTVDGTGQPTTTVLARGTSDGDTLPLASTKIFEWRTITFVTPVTLTGGVTYAIVLRLNPYAPVVVTDAATGVGGSPSVNAKGNIAIVETRVHYIGNDGNEYFILGALV